MSSLCTWCLTLESVYSMNSPSSASHWYDVKPMLQDVSWLIGHQDEIQDKINHRELGLEEVVFTSMHVFHFFPYWSRNWKQDMTIIQAFTVPDDKPLAGNRIGILHLSHKGILFQRTPDTVIQNSIVDPATGTIGVRFLSQWHELCSDGLHPKCVDVTLHKPSPADVSPITVRWHAALTSENGPPLHRDLDVHHHFFDALGDGYARGLFTEYCYYAADAASDTGVNRSAIVKFTIDATQERCVATLGPFVQAAGGMEALELHGCAGSRSDTN